MRAWGFLEFSFLALCATSAVLVPLRAGAANDPTPEPVLDPKAIYRQTVDAVNALTVPPYIAFTITDESTRKEGLEQERVRMVVRNSDGHALVDPSRDVDGNPVRERPHVVTGTVDSSILVYRPWDFPLADFGIRRGTTRPGIFEAQGTPEPAATGELKTLVTVTAVSLPYEITSLGETTIDGRDVAHLGLKPIRDPGHHVLRELWIDRSTSLPVRYVAERFVDAGLFPFRYLVTVDTALVDGHLINVSSDGHFSVHRGLIFNFSGEGRWSISDVSFPETEPDWAFDPALYNDHRGEAVPSFDVP